ncbi:hypothetical protein JCM8097_001421 [Rhodosporidiobolus ruineniae]
MDRLPDETVLLIGDFLEDERSSEHPKDAHDAQQGLAALARASKRYHALFDHLLYLYPALTSPKQGRRWVQTYTSLVNPFTLTRLGKAWPPRVFKPETLSYNASGSTSIPSLPALDGLYLFANLHEVSFRGGLLSPDFLPLLLGPDRPTRQRIGALELSNCISFDERGLDRTLAFLLDATLLEDWNGNLFRYDDPSLWPNNWVDEYESDAEEEEREWFFEEGVYEYVRSMAWIDFSVFQKVYDSMVDLEPFFGNYHTYSGFRSLTSLVLDITCAAQLYLLFYTHTFPSLRFLATTSGSSACIAPTDLQAMRLSITRCWISLPCPASRTNRYRPVLLPAFFRLRHTLSSYKGFYGPPHDSEFGRFLRPTCWGADEYAILNIVLETNLDPTSATVPPLTAHEVVTENVRSHGRLSHYVEGLRLDVLDCSKMVLTIREDFK